MLKADFVNELHRYFSANKAENDLTPERIAVFWADYQHEPLPRWRAAMSIAIGESGGRPSKARIEKALEEAERQEEAAKIAHDRGQSANPMRVALSGPAYLVDEPFLRIQRMVSDAIGSGCQPPEVAALLKTWEHTDPGTDYRKWIDALTNSASWGVMPLSAPDGGPLVCDTRRAV